MKSQHATTSKNSLAKEAWSDLFDFFISSRKERDPVIAQHKLSPNDAKGLWSLSLSDGKTMGALASEWTCDASNATWIVDRLEKRGLAERRSAPGDRRVKMVVLTPLGQKTRDAIMAAYHEPPEAMLALSKSDLEALHAIVGRLKVIAHQLDATSGAARTASEQPA